MKKKTDSKEPHIILYTGTNCAFSTAVVHALEEMKLPFIEKNIDENDSYVEEMLEYGGKVQTPYMIDEKHEIDMYESSHIIEYLMNAYHS